MPEKERGPRTLVSKRTLRDRSGKRAFRKVEAQRVQTMGFRFKEVRLTNRFIYETAAKRIPGGISAQPKKIWFLIQIWHNAVCRSFKSVFSCPLVPQHWSR